MTTNPLVSCFNNDGLLFAGVKGSIIITQGHVYLSDDCVARFATTNEAVKELAANGWKVTLDDSLTRDFAKLERGDV